MSDAQSNPFSRNRKGMTLGEGATLFLLSKRPDGVQLLGAGSSSEGYHMSAPEPEGTGAEAATRAALSDADLTPDDDTTGQLVAGHGSLPFPSNVKPVLGDSGP